MTLQRILLINNKLTMLIAIDFIQATYQLRILTQNFRVFFRWKSPWVAEVAYNRILVDFSEITLNAITNRAHFSDIH